MIDKDDNTIDIIEGLSTRGWIQYIFVKKKKPLLTPFIKWFKLVGKIFIPLLSVKNSSVILVVLHGCYSSMCYIYVPNQSV